MNSTPIKLADDCSNCSNHVQGNFNVFPCKQCLDGAAINSRYVHWYPRQPARGAGEAMPKASDGSTADYYKLPKDATELQDIIAAHNMNAQMGEIGRAWMRFGRCPHSPKLRELKKIIFYAEAEIDRLEKYEQ